MAEPLMTIKVAKVPRWMTAGIDLGPKITVALERIGSEIETRQGRGIGARRNVITREPLVDSQRILSTLHNPRTTGSSLQRHQEGRFRGMAPRVVKKYIVEPVEAEWAASQAGPSI
jgi:hypothetical protein